MNPFSMAASFTGAEGKLEELEETVYHQSVN